MILKARPSGPYAHAYWLLLLCNCTVVQLFWFRYFRTHPIWIWCISIVINIGMWLERYIIVVTSLANDFLPSSWGMYHGTIWDYMTFYGSIGLFLTLLFLFIRVLPVISITEMRELVHEVHERGHARPASASPTAPAGTAHP
jgi:molybdopterin-containing oxidoreductase family membrane subunit